jgi:uncharacterized protein DUF6152
MMKAMVRKVRLLLGSVGDSWYKNVSKPGNTIEASAATLSLGGNAMNSKFAGYIAITVAAFSLQAQAHHSFSMFDQEKTITISGTLKEFEWTNPHCWLHVNVTDPASGRVVDWAFEMGSVGQVAAQGWKADTVKPGDKITIEGHPMKDGSRGGQYRSAKLGDGRTFSQNNNPGR